MTTPDVPEAAQAQLLAAVDTALSRPQQAQGFLNNLPDLSSLGDYKDKVTEVLNTVVEALDTINGYAWLIPDQYEKPLQALTSALKKVQGWLELIHSLALIPGIIGAAVMLPTPVARADICPYPGVGVGVNILFGSGGHCDYPTEVNGSHLHCETGRAGLGGGFGFSDSGGFAGGISGGGVGGASCTWRCPDGVMAPAPNPPGAWKEYVVPVDTAFCVVGNHMVPNGFWSEPVRPEEGVPPAETPHIPAGAPGPLP